MIQLKNISLNFGERTLFNNISGYFGHNQRIGLVGRNGAGKSTLLKVIASLIQPDAGTIAFERGRTIAYMPQEVVLNSDKTVFDEAFTVFSSFCALEQEKEELEQLLLKKPTTIETILERYAYIQEKLQEFDKAAALSNTEKILDGLGFSHSLKKQQVSTLSVGWKMRLILAKLLLQKADFYLFDEPTNHLDITTKNWFFDFLRNAQCGFLLVTHDRHYLEKSCEYIYELERGNGTLFTGNFSTYIAQKEQQRVITQQAYERQQKEIARKQATIDRFRASASKAKMAQSMIKQLDKIELIEVEPPLPNVKFTFPQASKPGSIVLTVKSVKHNFDSTELFKNVHFEIQRGEKVALIAPNGTGKTTLFNIICGNYTRQQGLINFGYNVLHAIFEQDQARVLKPNNTVLQEVLDACPDITEANIRSFLGSFLFSGDDVYKKIDMLSGGERNRVAMVKVLLKKANFLLLDEPTNHLDLYAKEVLLQALLDYEGTILIVSHDHDFINKLATRILELKSDGVYSYHGNYDSYLEHKKQQHTSIPLENSYSKQENHSHHAQALSQKEIFAIRKELSSLESKISRLEQEIEQINKLFIVNTYGSPEYQKAAEQLQNKQKQLAQNLEHWEKLAENIS